MVFSWLRRTIRRRTVPVPLDDAIERKQKLATRYMMLTMAASGFIIYSTYKRKSELPDINGKKAEHSAEYWTDSLNIAGKIKVIHVKGTHITKEYEFERKKGDMTYVTNAEDKQLK